jgi:hypothetical protein
LNQESKISLRFSINDHFGGLLQMAKIKVHDLKPTGIDLFNDSDSYLNELGSDELEEEMGGKLVLIGRYTIITPTRPWSPWCYPTLTRTVITRTPVIL